MKIYYCKPGAKRSDCQGFSLIELLITVVIIGILTAIAVPSYTSYMEKSRRTAAIAFLSKAAGEQFRYFSDTNQYAADFKELGYGDETTALTDGGHYVVSINFDPEFPDRFTMTATAVRGGLQEKDTNCGAFIINSSDARTNSVVGANCW